MRPTRSCRGRSHALHAAGVRLHGDERARALAGDVPVDAATDADWDTEYLALELAVGVVDSTRRRRSTTSTCTAAGIPRRS